MFLFLLAVLLVASCGISTRGGLQSRLDYVDALLERKENDSAFSALKKIDKLSLDGEQQAYYNILFTQATCRIYQKVVSDSILDASLSYYMKSDDWRNLARCCYYKGVALIDKGKYVESIKYIKMGEHALRGKDAPRLSNMIYGLLTEVNLETMNDKRALHYAKLASRYAVETGDYDLIGSSYSDISACYERLGESDSSDFYIEKDIEVVSKMSDGFKQENLCNISLYYSLKGDFAKARLCANKALAIEASPYAMYALGISYVTKETAHISDSILSVAYPKANLSLKIKILTQQENIYAWQRKLLKAHKVADRINLLKDSLEQQQKSEDVMVAQLIYDENKKMDKAGVSFYILMLFSFILAAAAIACIVIYNKKVKYKNSVIKLKEVENASLSNEIIDKEKRFDRRVKSLEKSNSNSVGKAKERLLRGKRVLDGFLNGGSINTVSGDDILMAVDYYCWINKKFAEGIERGYSTLSANQKLYLVLKDYGLLDNGVKSVLAMQDGAFRTMKSRLRKKSVSI